MYKSGHSSKQYNYDCIIILIPFPVHLTKAYMQHMAAVWTTKLISITFNQLCCNAQLDPHWLALILVASDGKLELALMARSDATVGPAGDID